MRGGNRFGEDNLAGDPKADALTNNGQGAAKLAAVAAPEAVNVPVDTSPTVVKFRRWPCC